VNPFVAWIKKRFSLPASLYHHDPPSLPGDNASYESLLEDRIIVLASDIDDISAHRIVAQLLYLQSDSRLKPIDLLINSPGGAVTAGMAIIDTMRFVSNPVRTHCYGMAHGLAAVILSCGAPGCRSVSCDSRIGLVPLESREPIAHADFHRVRRELIDKTVEATGRTHEEIGQAMEASRVFTPPEAIEFGLVDRIA
jgi:ATP-dependent Clp protease protease subunit